MRIAVVANTAWFLYNFCTSTITALIAAGHEPVILAPQDAYSERLTSLGVRCIDMPVDAAGTHPLRELATLLRMHRLLRSLQLDAAFTYTPKVNIYVGLIAPRLGFAHVPNVSGLGRVFIERNWLTPIVVTMYRLALRRARRVVFLNDDDRRTFEQLGLVRPRQALQVPGAGINLAHFSPVALPRDAFGAGPVFLYVGRLLGDKGLVELAEAVRQVRVLRPGAAFRLLGSAGVNNPSAISSQVLAMWRAEGLFELLGSTDDVRPFIAAADAVVLPSYREGIPRALLEAAAMGRPCIATDVPGCRDVVEHERTGLLCEARSAPSLQAALLRFVDSSPAQRAEWGRAARHKMEQQFDERLVLEAYMKVTEDLARDRASRAAG